MASGFSQAAEECLSRAVKLEPGLVEGWNTLGEQYWKKGDLTAAKTCFTGALQQVSIIIAKNNGSLSLKPYPDRISFPDVREICIPQTYFVIFNPV